MYRRILVPVDGSEPSDAALANALKLAKEQRAKVRVLHVADVLPPSGVDGGYIDVDTFRESVLAAGQEVLRRSEARARAARVPVESKLLETLGHDVSGSIVDEAKRWRADLIALGTHGRTGVVRLFLGSVAEGVVRHASTAVLLTRGRLARKSVRKKRVS